VTHKGGARPPGGDPPAVPGSDSRARRVRARPDWRTPGQAIRLLVTGRTFRPAAPVALIVGSILSAVNEGSGVVNGTFDAASVVRICVNFAVPYLVASFGYLSACRAPPP
jgi:hypothetical protein